MSSDECDRRVREILRLLAAATELSVRELAKRFSVSVATVRRDLARMEEAGLVSRSYGRVTAVHPAYEVPVSYRGSQEVDAKRRIGVLAASLVPRGPLTMAMGGGTTVGSVAQRLTARSSLRVVTNSLDVAGSLMNRRKVKVVVTGGDARPSSQQLVGSLATAVLRHSRYDLAIIGVDGICGHGLTVVDSAEAMTSRVMIEQARQVIVVADSSKIGRSHARRVCGLESVDRLVTDSRVRQADLALIGSRGPSISLVSVSGP